MVDDQQAKSLVNFDKPDPNESLLSQISDPRTNPIPTHTRRFLEGWRVYDDVHVERGSAMRSPAMTQYVNLWSRTAAILFPFFIRSTRATVRLNNRSTRE